MNNEIKYSIKEIEYKSINNINYNKNNKIKCNSVDNNTNKVGVVKLN